jgi:succinate dehydrogenase/fumarate reductase flavoprotein subunit
VAEPLDVLADVLVIGGGPAGAWAAVAAAGAGARVVLVDKGYLGTSGATAPSNTGTWFVPPGEGRRLAIAQRQAGAGDLADPRWVERMLDTAWEKLHSLAARGYPFPRDDEGRPYLAILRGPDYMHFSGLDEVRVARADGLAIIAAPS